MAGNDRVIVVTGATGRQGGAVARHLLAEGYRVRGVTRSPDSTRARKLASLGADVVAAQEARFLAALAKAIRASKAMAGLKDAGVNAPKAAEILYATARGLKHSAGTRDAFQSSMRAAVRLFLGARA